MTDKAKLAMGGWATGMLGLAGYVLGLYSKREVPLAMADVCASAAFEYFVLHLRLIHDGEFKRARRYLVLTEHFFDTRVMPEIYDELPEALVLRDLDKVPHTWDVAGVQVATSPDAVLEYATRCIDQAADALSHMEKHWPGVMPEAKGVAYTALMIKSVCVEKAKAGLKATLALRPGLRR